MIENEIYCHINGFLERNITLLHRRKQEILWKDLHS